MLASSIQTLEAELQLMHDNYHLYAHEFLLVLYAAVFAIVVRTFKTRRIGTATLAS